jgi:hypothetical protein
MRQNDDRLVMRSFYIDAEQGKGVQFALPPRDLDQGHSFCHRRHGCYRRLGEIPQQVVRRQTILKAPRMNNVSTRDT